MTFPVLLGGGGGFWWLAVMEVNASQELGPKLEHHAQLHHSLPWFYHWGALMLDIFKPYTQQRVYVPSSPSSPSSSTSPLCLCMESDSLQWEPGRLDKEAHRWDSSVSLGANTHNVAQEVLADPRWCGEPAEEIRGWLFRWDHTTAMTSAYTSTLLV